LPKQDDLIINQQNLLDPAALQKRIDFASIPPLQLCIHRIADVRVENFTYLFDISEVTGLD
jgi:hypothetical protein